MVDYFEVMTKLSIAALSINFFDFFGDKWHLLLFTVFVIFIYCEINFMRDTSLYEFRKNVSERIKHSLIYSPIFITLVKLPFFIQPLETGLDPSWTVGLNWALQKKLQWGTQIVFTYGPTHWLLNHTLALDSSTLLFSLVTNVTIFFFALHVIIRNLRKALIIGAIPDGLAVLIVLALLVVDYNILDIYLVSISILLFMDRNPYKQNKHFNVGVLFAILILAFVSLCKFSYMAVSICFLLFYSVLSLYNRKIIQTLLSWVVFIISFLGFWYVAGQDIENLSNYFESGFQVAQGYSEAMSYPLWINEKIIKRYLIIMILAVSFIGGLVVMFINSVYRRGDLWYLLLLSGIITFLAFKEGFVRYDKLHYTQFFAQALFVVVGLLVMINLGNSQGKISKVFLYSMFFICLFFTESFHFFRYKNLYAAFDEKFRVDKLNEEKIKLVNVYKTKSDVIRKIGNATVDIVPYEISFLYCHNLNWSPRPVIQSYVAYTSKLDSLNDSFYKSKYAPQQVIYSYLTIDDRYPLFDEPKMFKTLLNGYEWYNTVRDKRTVVLRKKEHLTEGKIVSSANKLVSINEKILVPSGRHTYTYAKITVRLSFIGKMINFFCNVPYIKMKMYFKNNNSPIQFRLIRSTADDGLLVSSYAKNVNDVMDIFCGAANSNVSSIAIVGNPYLYEKQIDLQFDLLEKPRGASMWLERQIGSHALNRH